MWNYTEGSTTEGVWQDDWGTTNGTWSTDHFGADQSLRIGVIEDLPEDYGKSVGEYCQHDSECAYGLSCYHDNMTNIMSCAEMDYPTSGGLALGEHCTGMSYSD